MSQAGVETQFSPRLRPTTGPTGSRGVSSWTIRAGECCLTPFHSSQGVQGEGREARLCGLRRSHAAWVPARPGSGQGGSRLVAWVPAGWLVPVSPAIGEGLAWRSRSTEEELFNSHWGILRPHVPGAGPVGSIAGFAWVRSRELRALYWPSGKSFQVEATGVPAYPAGRGAALAVVGKAL